MGSSSSAPEHGNGRYGDGSVGGSAEGDATHGKGYGQKAIHRHRHTHPHRTDLNMIV